jgi:hypothetical protein
MLLYMLNTQHYKKASQIQVIAVVGFWYGEHNLDFIIWEYYLHYHGCHNLQFWPYICLL